MKKVIFIIFIAFLWFLPSSVSAIGTLCCSGSTPYYDSSKNQCTDAANFNGNHKNPIYVAPEPCLEGEKCVSTEGGGPIQGMCTSSDTVTKCCPGSNQTYIFASNKCREYGSKLNPVKLTDPVSCIEGERCVGTEGGGPTQGMCNACTANGKYATAGRPCCSGAEEPQSGLCIEKNTPNPSPTSNSPMFSICNPVVACQDNEDCECKTCLTNGGIWTAIGCIHTDPKTFIADFLKIALGVAGGIALLLMVYGAFLISMSAGDPKKADEGKEIITGTIGGLLFIIFSVILLQLIGVQILNIPGL